MVEIDPDSRTYFECEEHSNVAVSTIRNFAQCELLGLKSSQERKKVLSQFPQLSFCCL